MDMEVGQHLEAGRGWALCGLWRALYPDLLQPVAVGSCGGLDLLFPRSELGWSGLGRPGLGSAGPAGSAVRANGVEGSAVDDLLEGSWCGPALLSANRLSGCVAVLGRAAGDRVLVPLHVPGQAARESLTFTFPGFKAGSYLGLGRNLSSEGPMGPVSAPDLLMSPRSASP